VLKEVTKNYERPTCQRFLERGNKVVPPNYEEQDIEDYRNSHMRPALYKTQPELEEEFDEEINGVNLGKLSTVYGPNSLK